MGGFFIKTKFIASFTKREDAFLKILSNLNCLSLPRFLQLSLKNIFQPQKHRFKSNLKRRIIFDLKKL